MILSLVDLFAVSFLLGAAFPIILVLVRRKNAARYFTYMLMMFLLLWIVASSLFLDRAIKTANVILYVVMPLLSCWAIHWVIWRWIDIRGLTCGWNEMTKYGTDTAGWMHLGAATIVTAIPVVPQWRFFDMDVRPLENLARTASNSGVWLIFPLVALLVVFAMGEYVSGFIIRAVGGRPELPTR